MAKSTSKASNTKSKTKAVPKKTVVKTSVSKVAKPAKIAEKLVSKKSVGSAKGAAQKPKLTSDKVEKAKTPAKQAISKTSKANPKKDVKTAKKEATQETKRVSISSKNPLSKHTKISTLQSSSASSSASAETKVQKTTHSEDDHGELLLGKAREEMASINADVRAVEKASKVKPIKIERGNLADEKAKWQELFKRYGKDKAVSYKMTDSFEALKPINHKVLGWGFVLTNENNRLEVLFENGIKMLISNYKPS